jgi:ankyrin repeat protein
LLIDRGAEIEAKEDTGFNALLAATAHSSSTSTLATVRFLLDQGAYIDATNDLLMTPLMIAIRYSDETSSMDTVRYLLKRGANVNIADRNGFTSLIIATGDSENSLPIIQLLLDQGAYVHVTDNIGNTVLHHALEDNPNIKIIELLLNKGANPNIKNNSGITPLMTAVIDTDVKIIELLLDKGANINDVDNDNATALWHAVANEADISVIKLLLERGADPFNVNDYEADIPDSCRTDECKDLILSTIWKTLYNRDIQTAQQYSTQTSLPKDIWTLILLNKRQQLLCSNLSSEQNREILILFAIELEIPITNDMTKGQLCGIISRQLAYGKGIKGVTEEMNRYKSQIMYLAKKFNINANRSMEEILLNLSKVF